MSVLGGIFDVEQSQETLIITPLKNLYELDYQEIQLGGRELLELLSTAPVKNVIMDFHKTEGFGSTALGFFVRLWKKVRQRNGSMAFCNLSDNEKEILQITKLDGLWNISSDLDQARKSINA
jgi:anti-anti-sigma factor